MRKSRVPGFRPRRDRSLPLGIYRENPKGKSGYDVLHPTKGWRHFSAKRARLLTRVIAAARR